MAQTVAQLQDLLGEYIAPNGEFARALKQVLTRLHAMGTWKDTTGEISLSGEYGYVSLPHDVDGVLAATVNDRPGPVRSLWHDVRLVGRTAQVGGYHRAIDAGYHPVILEMSDVQDADDVVATNLLRLVNPGTTDYPGAFSSSVTVTTNAVNDGGQIVTHAVDSGTQVNLTASDDFDRILGITYSGVTKYLDLIDPDFPTKVIATLAPGSGVCRFRRFRTPEKHADTTIHFLVKYACPAYLAESTVVYLDNINVLKHGLLAVIAEDNSDLTKASAHWDECRKMLDEELSTIIGAAKPTLQFGDVGGGRIYNLM